MNPSYEYRVEVIPAHPQQSGPILNHLGAEGWRVVAVVPLAVAQSALQPEKQSLGLQVVLERPGKAAEPLGAIVQALARKESAT